MLVFEWVRNKRILGKSEIASFAIDGRPCALPISVDEYIGGLSDFTGEIGADISLNQLTISIIPCLRVGRLALPLASKRDIAGVSQIHQADIVIANFIAQVNITNRYGKKLEAVNTNLRKVLLLL